MLFSRESAMGIREGKVRQSLCHTLPWPGSISGIATGQGWKGRGEAKSTCSQEAHLVQGTMYQK